MFITCFFKDTIIFNCNINLFKQLNITCNNQIDDFIYFNFIQNIANKFVSFFFFKICAKVAYTYFNDNNINVNNFKNKFVSYCIKMFCQAFLKQLIKKKFHEHINQK